MVDDRPEPTGPAPDPGRARREPPTIDLEATEISAETPNAAAAAEPEPEPGPSAPRASTGAMSAAIIAAVSGASAAALVLGAAWFAGWPAAPSPTAPAAQVNAAAVDDLAARLASVAARLAKPAAATPDPPRPFATLCNPLLYFSGMAPLIALPNALTYRPDFPSGGCCPDTHGSHARRLGCMR